MANVSFVLVSYIFLKGQIKITSVVSENVVLEILELILKNHLILKNILKCLKIIYRN